MVINHQQSWVYLGPPKTGTTTLTYLLTDGDDWNVRTPLPRKRFGGVKHAGQHCMDVPAECADYFVFASVRNPFTRAVSLWRHRNTESRRLKPRRAWMEFEDFVAEILCGTPSESADKPEGAPPADPFYHFTLSRWFKWVPRIDRFVRQESLEADLNELNLAEEVPVPRLNKSRAFSPTGADADSVRGSDWRALYATETEALVLRWANQDFQRFGYPTQVDSSVVITLPRDVSNVGPPRAKAISPSPREPAPTALCNDRGEFGRRPGENDTPPRQQAACI